MITNNYALLIGVEDYSAYDRSQGGAPGTSNVAGAVADARVWYRTCRAMGIPPERIVVLTSPALQAAQIAPDAQPNMVGAATREGIAWGVDWLSKGLSSSRSAGLLTFSGHGEQARGVLLCPSDMTSESDVVQLGMVRGLVGGGPEVGSLTVVLDCCRDAVAMPRRGAVRARLRGLRRRIPRGPGDSRVLAACEVNGSASSGVFGGETMGAFTWALTSALGQWSAEEEGGLLRLDVTYGELLHRVRVLLRALSYEQIPVLQGAPLAFRLPFLEPEGVRVLGSTRSEPTCRRGKRQLDPGQRDFRVYVLWYQTETTKAVPLAKVLVTNTAGSVETTAGSFDLDADDEYWFVSSSAVGQMASATGGVVTVAIEADYAYEPSDSRDTPWSGDVTGYHVVQRTPAPVKWAVDATAWPSGAFVFQAEDRSMTLAFTLQREASTQGGDLDFRRIDWVQPGSSTLFGKGAPTSVALRQMVASTAGPGGQYRAVSDFELFCDLK